MLTNLKIQSFLGDLRGSSKGFLKKKISKISRKFTIKEKV